MIYLHEVRKIYGTSNERAKIIIENNANGKGI